MHSPPSFLRYHTGSEPSHAWRHFALNIPYYTHFTSPIRRYADCMVHRLLQATLETDSSVRSAVRLANKEGGGLRAHHVPTVYQQVALSSLPEASDLNKQATECNDRKSAADAASEASSRVFMCLYLKDHPTEKEAFVLSLGAKSFTIYVPDWGLQQMVYVDKCGAVG